jgi:signal transduction histidine kinase
MKIKDRLAIYFTLASTLTLLIVLFATYFTFSEFMQSDFFDRLTDRTMVTANLYLEADEISAEKLEKTRGQYLEKLNGELIRIYDAKNKLVFIGAHQSPWSNEIINKVRRQGKLKFKDGEVQVVGIFYKDNQGDFVIIAAATDQSTLYRLEKLKTVMSLIFIIIFVGLLLSARSIAKRMLKPLNVLLEDVRRIKSSNLDFRVQERETKDEINLLAANFNKLMDHLEQAFVLQKTFIANASHELRTPVTSMMMAAEIVLSKDREPDDYRTALLSVLEDAERMDRIITGLLSLAHADVEYGAAKVEDLSLSKMLISIEEEWRMQQNSGKLIMTYEKNGSADFTLAANPTLLKIAFDNIISNAFKFSDQRDVRCVLKIAEKTATVLIIDTGPGIPEANQPFIFDPFYRSGSATREMFQGNGMGLFMAKKIVTLFHGTITVESAADQGSTFIIGFSKL